MTPPRCVYAHASISNLSSEELKQISSPELPTTRYLKQSKLHPRDVQIQATMLLNEKEHNMEKQLPGHKQKGIAHNETLYQLLVKSYIQIKANAKIIKQGKKLKDVAASSICPPHPRMAKSHLPKHCFLIFFGWESYSLHTHVRATKETTSVKWKAIHNQSCKLPSLLGWWQTQMSAKRQHVKQSKQPTRQLFTNLQPSLFIFNKQSITLVRINPTWLSTA